MVEYKKKKLILQSGGTRNYYYKVSSNGKKKQVSKNEYLEKKGGSENSNNFMSIKELIDSLKQTLEKISKENNQNNFTNYKIKIENQIKKLEKELLLKDIQPFSNEDYSLRYKYYSPDNLFKGKKIYDETIKRLDSEKLILQDKLFLDFDDIYIKMGLGQTSKEIWENYEKLTLEIANKNLEIPTVFKWKSAFDDVRKMHFKANGSRVNKIPRPASNSWEGSFVMSLWEHLFH